MAPPLPGSDSTRGQRTIIETLSHKAAVEPNRIFGSFAKTADLDDGFHDFTFAELANAVQACAWFIHEVFGSSESFETLIYLGVNDFRYTIVLFAAVMCGYKALFVNPKYPLGNIALLMEKPACTRILYSSELSTTVDAIQRESTPQLQINELIPASYWVTAKRRPFPSFSQPKPFRCALGDPVVVLHSSGTTGSPKPITYNNAWLALQETNWPDIDDRATNLITFREECNGGFTYSQFPQCHFGGVLYTTLRPLWTCSAGSVLGPPGIEGAALALEIIKRKNAKALAATPLLLEGIVKLAGGAEALKKLNAVSFAGGPLRCNIGDDLVGGERGGGGPVSVYGSTELGACPGVLPDDPRDWQWMQFHPDLHVEMDATGDEAGTHELVFPDCGEEVNRMRGTYWSLGVREYWTRDLFVRHNEKGWLWKYSGRKDDIIVLENAGKLNPVPIESMLAQHPGVRGVLVAGMHRWPACVLIEPVETVKDKQAFVREMAHRLEKANQGLREDLRIPLRMVVVLEPDGLVRGLKGQIVRAQSVEKLNSVVDALYKADK